MAKDIKFNIKLQVDGKEHIASASTGTKELAKQLGIAESRSKGFGITAEEAMRLYARRFLNAHRMRKNKDKYRPNKEIVKRTGASSYPISENKNTVHEKHNTTTHAHKGIIRLGSFGSSPGAASTSISMLMRCPSSGFPSSPGFIAGIVGRSKAAVPAEKTRLWLAADGDYHPCGQEPKSRKPRENPRDLQIQAQRAVAVKELQGERHNEDKHPRPRGDEAIFLFVLIVRRDLHIDLDVDAMPLFGLVFLFGLHGWNAFAANIRQKSGITK